MFSHTHTLSKLSPEKAVLRREGWRHPRQSTLPSSGPETTAHSNCCILLGPHCATATYWLGLLGLWQLKDLAWCYVTFYGKCRVRRNRKFFDYSLHSVCVMGEQPSDTGGWEDQERDQYIFVARKYVRVKWTLITNQLSLLLDYVLGVF